MTAALFPVLLLLSQADAGAPLEDPALAEARAALDTMKNLLRAVEHGLQEANDLGDRAAFDCVKTGHLAIAHRVDSAEQWSTMLPDAVATGDPEQISRLLRHITDAQRDVQKRASDLSSCRLSVAEPPVPVLNPTWFGCQGTPPVAANPAWRSCEQRWTSAVTFGLEALLIALPVGAAVAVTQRPGALAGFGGLTLESSAGGLLGGLALFAASGGLALAITAGMSDARASRIWPFVGVFTALGAGAGSIIGMALERPGAGLAAPVAAAVSYLVVGAISAVLVIVFDHFSVASGGEDVTFAERSFAIAPALMALSSIVIMPAAWSLFSK